MAWVFSLHFIMSPPMVLYAFMQGRGQILFAT